MGLLSRLSQLWRRKTSGDGTIEDWWTEYGWPNRSAAGISVNQITAMQVSTVLACVSILSEDVAKLPVHVYRRQSNGQKVILADHPVERLLQRPNPWQTTFEFFEMEMSATLLRSNAYAPIIRNSRGEPIALVPVNPDRVWIYEAPDGSIFYMVARQGPHDMATLASLPMLVPSEDMLHLRWLSLDNSLWGTSRIGLAREPIGLALAQQELAARLAGNATNLGGVLQTDQKLTQEAIDRLKANWKTNNGGLANAGGTAVLEMGLKWTPLGMTAQAAEFIAQRAFQVNDIARLFRVPPHKLAVMERMAGTSVEQLDQDYMNNTISSWLRRWETKLEATFDLVDSGAFVEFDVTQFLRASQQVRYNAYRTGIIGMFLTPNEVRRAEGLPDVPDGDTLYQPTNVAPIGFEPAGSETGPGSDVTGAAAPGGAGDPAAVNDDASSE